MVFESGFMESKLWKLFEVRADLAEKQMKKTTAKTLNYFPFGNFFLQLYQTIFLEKSDRPLNTCINFD